MLSEDCQTQRHADDNNFGMSDCAHTFLIGARHDALHTCAAPSGHLQHMAAEMALMRACLLGELDAAERLRAFAFPAHAFVGYGFDAVELFLRTLPGGGTAEEVPPALREWLAVPQKRRGEPVAPVLSFAASQGAALPLLQWIARWCCRNGGRKKSAKHAWVACAAAGSAGSVALLLELFGHARDPSGAAWLGAACASVAAAWPPFTLGNSTRARVLRWARRGVELGGDGAFVARLADSGLCTPEEALEALGGEGAALSLVKSATKS